VTHIDGCTIKASPLAEEKIKIINSDVPSGLGFDNPALLIKNSRILSNSSPVIYSDSITDPVNGFQIGVISSALYVTDSSTDFLDLSIPYDCFAFGAVTNTQYDPLGVNIININGGFQIIQSNFED
jgi:hypothetical protein